MLTSCSQLSGWRFGGWSEVQDCLHDHVPSHHYVNFLQSIVRVEDLVDEVKYKTAFMTTPPPIIMLTSCSQLSGWRFGGWSEVQDCLHDHFPSHHYVNFLQSIVRVEAWWMKWSTRLPSWSRPSHHYVNFLQSIVRVEAWWMKWSTRLLSWPRPSHHYVNFLQSIVRVEAWWMKWSTRLPSWSRPSHHYVNFLQSIVRVEVWWMKWSTRLPSWPRPSHHYVNFLQSIVRVGVWWMKLKYKTAFMTTSLLSLC